VLRFAPFNVAGAVCVIVASQLTGTAVYALWVAPMAFQYIASAMAAGVDESSRSGFDIRPAHFVERHGGLLIIALGESLAVIGIGVTDLTLNLSTLATAVLGLLLASALWWTYFATDADQAETHLRDAPIKDRVRMALLGYFYAFLPMLLGITGLAAGLKLTISHVDAPLPLAPAFVLAGGVASYLLSNTLFRWTMHIQRSWYRVAAAIVALMTTALGTSVAGIVELVGLLATVVMMLVLEARYGRLAPGGCRVV
jgi:low temperature requirement protein LtrA